MSTPPIVIAGAGIAGLTLGRCLKKRGIPCLIVERATSAPRYNYGFTLYPWAYKPLLPFLQLDESTFRAKASIDADLDGAGAMSNTMSNSIDVIPRTFRCHRGRLERLLRGGQDIQWEHAVEKIDTSSQKISIQFGREKTIETKLLVGADGVHSQVRTSLTPDVLLKVLPYVVFNGTRKMSFETYRNRLQPHLHGDSIAESRHSDVVLQISVNDFSTNDVEVGYTYSRPARPNDPLHKPDRPISGATDIPEAFYEELETLTSKELGPAFTEMFDADKARGDRLLHWLMRSTVASEEDINKLADRGVLLVGDAAHTMPILGGEGGNTAMKDWVDLAEHIAIYGPHATKAYCAGRYEMWKKCIEDSELRLADMHISAVASL